MTQRLAEEIGLLLQAHGQRVTVAESCTGGLICGAITDIAGSSGWFERGYVVYSNDAKQQMLGVPQALLEEYGAVSGPVVESMARQARETARADWALAVSGIAGPGGGSAEKPVGLVWFAWIGPGVARSESCIFSGDRAAVRAQTVQHSLERLLDLIEEQA